MSVKSHSNGALTARHDFACTLAQKVGLQALRYWNEQGVEGLGTEVKGLQDFVTKADKDAEHTIRTELADMFPEDGFIGEESGGEVASGGYWVVDPIDGTSNYLRGLRHWGVSIAYVEDGEAQVGVIHDTPTDRIYSAMRGFGAKRDGSDISVSRTSDPTMAMGIVGASRRAPFDLYLRQLQALYNDGIEHRKIGAAAIGIVRVAEGVADFYYEKHLNSWDALAALLIAEEAGAKVVTPPMDEFVPNGGEVLCSTPALSARLERILLNET
ncbi:MAG: inositol monophosphatase [Rhodobacteraceae bacterium]|nr:inositol monophosphatase [Paracoccaceae bacterium]